MKPIDLCMQLVMAESEADVISLLKTNNLWDDSQAWTDYGLNENNWSIIGNQQGQSEAALVEKLINAGDSILMDRCRREGLNPSTRGLFSNAKLSEWTTCPNR